jgi:hypothetical protein
MKKLLLFMLLLPLFLSAQVEYDRAAEDTSTESERIKQSIPKHLKKGKPQKHKYNDLWGYILNDSILIPFKYYELEGQYSDLMVCREPRGLYGAINKKGELVIPYGYNLLEKTEDGLLWGWKTDKGYGLMTLSNKILVPFDYKNSNRRDSFYVFSSIYKQLIVRHLGNEKMEEILEGDFEEISFFNPKKHPLLAVKQKGLWGLMDYNKRIFVPCEYEKIQSIEVNKAIVGKGGKTGIINFEAKVLVPFEYEEIYTQLRNGLIPVANKDATGKRRVGLVDSMGQILLPLEYEQVEQFYNCDLMKVKKEGKWGIIDKNGKRLSDIQFNDISDWKHIETVESINQEGILKLTSKDAYGLYFVHKYDNNGKVGLWNLEKGQILPPEYDYFEIDQLKGLIKVSLGEKSGLYNIEGKQLIGFEYGALLVMNNPSLVQGFKNSKITFVNMQDGKQVQPEFYDNSLFVDMKVMRGYLYTNIGKNCALHAPDGRRLTPHQYQMGMRKCENLPELSSKLPVGRKIVACTYREIEGRLANIALDDLGGEYEFLVK